MTVHFIGAGPGAPDLITVRGLNLIRRCPVVLYAGSLVPPEIVAEAMTDARVIDTAPLHLDEIITEMDIAHQLGQNVARVHSGDQSIYGAIAEQICRLADAGNQQKVLRLPAKRHERPLQSGKNAEIPATGAPGDRVSTLKVV